MTIWSLAKEFDGYLTAIMSIDKVSNQIEIHQEQTITQTVQYTSLLRYLISHGPCLHKIYSMMTVLIFS